MTRLLRSHLLDNDHPLDHRMPSIMSEAYWAFRNGGPTEAQTAYAQEQIKRRGLQPIIDKINERLERGLRAAKKDEAA